MKTMLKTLVLSLTAASLLNAFAGERELSYATEDVAYQAVSRLSADGRLKGIKNIAFVRLMVPEGRGELRLGSNLAQTFEAALSSVPTDLRFLIHGSRDAEWTLIDEIFDQASDFESYNPATHPKFKQLKLADALMYGQVIDATESKDGLKTTIRISLKLLKVATAELIWGGVIEGVYNDEGPDNQMMPYFARKAVEAAAADAVAKLPANLNDYGVFLLPFDGPYGRSMTQVFLNALTMAGKQEKVVIYDLPNGGASDRMMARFLRERAGAGVALNESLLKQVEAKAGGKVKGGKLAILSGMVTSGRVFPETLVDPTGRPVDVLTGSSTDARGNATHFEVIADLKFRDINDSFRVVAAVGATGVYDRDVGDDVKKQLLSFVTVRNIIFAVVILIVIWFVMHFIIRVR